MILRRFFLLLLSIFGLLASASDTTLDSLDHMITHRSQYEAPRREAVYKARIDYEKATDDSDRYNSLRNLYEVYRSFRIDSALICARKRLDIARRLGSHSKIASATINLAEGYTRTGSADLAINILDTLNPEWLETYHLKYRTGVYREALRIKSITAILPEEKEDALRRIRELDENSLKDSPANSRGHYTLTAGRLCDAGLYAEAISTVEEACRNYDFSQDAAMLYTIGDIYLKAGFTDKAKEYMAQSAMLDISSGTKEYRSLISLALLLFDEGDVARAFDYINCAFEDAQFSHANLRTAEIMKSMPVIDKAFHDTERKVVTRTRLFLIIAAILVVILLLLVAWGVKTLRDRRKMLAVIEAINASLAEKNEALAKADALKLHYVNILMKAYSQYIARLKAFRKNVYRFLKTGQHDKALDLVQSNRVEANDIAGFLTLFDEAFLSMFPDFIDRVNAMLKTKIEPRDPGHLTPELRVIALMKLHMDSTEEISALMHYSSQTVYNLRSSIRGMLAVTRDEFIEQLEQL